jgi:hypothetical protein
LILLTIFARQDFRFYVSLPAVCRPLRDAQQRVAAARRARQGCGCGTCLHACIWKSFQFLTNIYVSAEALTCGIFAGLNQHMRPK